MITIFLATVIGWYLVIVSVFMLTRHHTLHNMMNDIILNRALIFVLALVTLILGLIMVTSHNLWVMGWPVIVTLLSWLVLISGVIRLFFPDAAIRMAKYCLKHPKWMIISGIISLLIGLFLLFKVYFG